MMTSICHISHMHLPNNEGIRMMISQEDAVAVEAQQDTVMIQTKRLCRLHHHLVLDHQRLQDFPLYSRATSEKSKPKPSRF